MKNILYYLIDDDIYLIQFYRENKKSFIKIISINIIIIKKLIIVKFPIILEETVLNNNFNKNLAII